MIIRSVRSANNSSSIEPSPKCTVVSSSTSNQEVLFSFFWFSMPSFQKYLRRRHETGRSVERIFKLSKLKDEVIVKGGQLSGHQLRRRGKFDGLQSD
mmetsp:Transcript_8216/g.17127  ORF Transcript_8216/g.17127 Transcript_8216/m.17127 type:complete len:97 (+) Transcript_8216:952-1242(+)